MSTKKQKLFFRVGIYLAIIAAIAFFPRGSNAPAPPKDSGKLPTVQDLTDPEEEEELADLSGAYPEATAYFWARVDHADGSQEVHVLLRFLRNVSELNWGELKLRPPAKLEDPRDLASAQPSDGSPRPDRGLYKIVFKVPAGVAPFKEGRIYCWIRDLCELQQGQRIAVDRLDETLKQLKAEDAAKKTAPSGNEAPAPAEEKAAP